MSCINLRFVPALMALSLMTLSACSTNTPQDVTTSTTSQEATTVEDVVPTTLYSNYFFQVAVPDNWEVVSSDGPDIPAFLSVQRKDHQALVTLKVSRSDLNIDELCQLAAKGFVVNSADIVRGPEVNYGTCIIQSDTLGKKAAFWARRYDDGSVYAINFEGELEIVNEILGRAQGDEKFMSLFIMPLNN